METKKTMIVVRGIHNTGKTSSIKQAYEILTSPEVGCTLATGVGNNPVIYPDGKDMYAVLEYKGVRIGINTMGDPKTDLPDILYHLTGAGCAVILTPCRTAGVTERDTDDIAKERGYGVIWTANYSTESDELGERDALNSAFARAMVSLIQELKDKLAPAS